MHIDTSSEYGARAARRLGAEIGAWLTTVRADGTPLPARIWFLWDGETALVYSQPNQIKLRNLERNPSCALHLDGDSQGGNVIVLIGSARVEAGAPPADRHPDYLAKYGDGMTRVAGSAAQFAERYSVAIRFTPSKLIGH